jgi:hypothetical protein
MVAMRLIWFDCAESGDAEAGARCKHPMLSECDLFVEGQLGSGQKADRYPGLAFLSKASGRGPAVSGCDQRLSDFGGTRRHSVKTIVTHQISSSFEIAHPHPRWGGCLSVWFEEVASATLWANLRRRSRCPIN